MEHIIEILGVEYVVEFDYKITFKGDSGVAPSLNYPGDPPSPIEYNINIVNIRDTENIIAYLELPHWLRNLIEYYLYNSEEVYLKIEDSIREDFDE